MKPRATRVLPTTLRSTSATTLIRFDVSDVFKLSFSFTLAELLKNHFLFNILLPGAVLWETIWGGRWVQMPSGGYDIASFFLTKLFTISQCFSWEYLIALHKPPLPHRPMSFPPMLSPGASSPSQGDLKCDQGHQSPSSLVPLRLTWKLIIFGARLHNPLQVPDARGRLRVHRLRRRQP